MYVATGRNLLIPDTIEKFEGPTTVTAAKALLEKAFGIGDRPREDDMVGLIRGRATVRHVTPYMFVTKEIILNESALLYGLDDPDEAPGIRETLPYFLRATDEESVALERRLKQLQRAYEREEARNNARAASKSQLKERAWSLLSEAYRIGLVAAEPGEGSEAALVAQLQDVSAAPVATRLYPNEAELRELHASRRQVLDGLAIARRRLQATRTAAEEVNGFQSTVERQRQKLSLADHLQLESPRRTCPLCDTPSEAGARSSEVMRAVISTIRGEAAAVERVQPKLADHQAHLEEDIATLNQQLRRIDENIRSWLRQNSEAREMADIAHVRAHLLGRVSFFLESVAETALMSERDLTVLRAEIEELSSLVDKDAKAVRLRHAESKVSQYATFAFGQLPTIAPCVQAELSFSARDPSLSIIEAESGAVLKMLDVGSDQNYLALHIALSFALQQFFEVAKAPVPGLLVFDQISRPYFPSKGEEDWDEAEIDGQQEDEEFAALRKHVNFLFSEVARRAGLQVLLIEHAYFADDPDYVAATRYRWTKRSGEALIPADWPTRPDVTQ
ncbi:MAG TPA: DUF3732 domain-containing protein [Longimicrobiales bacterium]|nr:DUF3732 domain-containing protein [Longimicrobiales bacterium]